jgi:hypothetical protein
MTTPTAINGDLALGAHLGYSRRTTIDLRPRSGQLATLVSVAVDGQAVADSPLVEALMSGGLDDRLNVRVAAHMVKRLDSLVPRIGGLPEFSLVSAVERSDVVRIVLLRGLDALERELSGEGTRPASSDAKSVRAQGRTR